MTRVRSLLSALGTGFAFTLGSRGGDQLAFQPQAGSTLSKTFTTESEFALDDLSILFNGQDVGELIGQLEISFEQQSKIEVSDAYKAVAKGRPTELLRTFEALSGSTHMEMSPAQMEMPEVASASELEGKTVAFRWNDEEQGYELSFHDGEGDESLLEGLEEDMDLRVFLPGAEVAEDDTWSVELAELACLLMPGGNLRMLPQDMEVDPEAMKMFEEIFDDLGELGDQLEGECTCTYAGVREEDGVRLAEIAITLEIATTLDLSGPLSEVIRKAIEEGGVGDRVQFSLETADFSVDFEGSGTLLWNPAAGRMHAFQIGGDATLGIDLVVSVEAEGESQDVDASFEMSGSARQVVETKE